MGHARPSTKSPRLVTLWPVGLVGRLSVVLLTAVILVFIASAFLYEEAETARDEHTRLQQLSETLSSDVRVLVTTPYDQRNLVGALLSENGLLLKWRPPSRLADINQPHRLTHIESVLKKKEPELLASNLHVWADGLNSSGAHGILNLADGSHLDIYVPDLLERHHITWGLVYAAMVAGAIAFAGAITVWGMSTSLRGLATVADSIANSDETCCLLVEERGPKEVRGLARTFNAMQHRIHRLINDRTEILAAISHDLRTPLARLRLRAGFLNDANAQRAIEADIDEMEAMTTGVIAYLSGDLNPEAKKKVDLVALFQTLLNSKMDAGFPAVFDGPDHCYVWIRPLATKRVFANLIDNACAYGGNAHVILRSDSDSVTVSIIDDGPGLPEAELETVFRAFYRVESSRSRATGGTGLGLAIVKREVDRARGTVTLENEPGRGLRVTVYLPMDRPPE